MSTFDQSRDKSRDEQIESLMRDFFADEMPAEVREIPDRPVVRRAPAIPSAEHLASGRRRTQVARIVGAIAAIAAVILLAWSISPVVEPNGPDNLAALPTPHNLPSEMAVASIDLPDVQESAAVPNESKPREDALFSVPAHALPYAQTEAVASLGAQKYATRQGPVEQRTNVRTTSVSFYEPRSGAQVRLQVPEIEIEILAADNEGT